MKLWFVASKYDEGVWLSEDSDSDLAYGSEELASSAKAQLDKLDLAAHRERTTRRLKRWNQTREARSILQANGFQDVDQLLPPHTSLPEESEFESRYEIKCLEIKSV